MLIFAQLTYLGPDNSQSEVIIIRRSQKHGPGRVGIRVAPAKQKKSPLIDEAGGARELLGHVHPLRNKILPSNRKRFFKKGSSIWKINSGPVET